ncbi:MAG: hypothetical protein PVI70_19375 [Gammaproteobacteria bacterium]
MKTFAKTTLIAGLICTSQSVHPGPISKDFSPGEKLTANRMNGIWSAVNDNDARITAIEAMLGNQQNQEIDVDCNLDADALKNLTIQDHTTYLLTGICNGPVTIYRKRNVVLKGASSDKTQDVVQLPPGIVANPFAAIGIYESIVELRDITADSGNYVAGSGNPWGSGVSTVAVGQNASARIYNTDIKGGDWGLDVFRNGYVKTYETVTITGFNENGVSAYYNSHVEVANDIIVTGRVGTTMNYPTATAAGYSSVIDIKGGGTIASPTGGSSQYGSPVVIGAYNAGVVRVRSAITLEGGVEIGAGSLLRMDAGILTGNIDCYDSSHCRLQNISHSGGYVWAARNASIRIGGSSTIDTTGTGFTSTLGANIGVRDSASVTATSIQIRKNATFYTGGNPNLNNSPIFCDSRSDQVNEGGSPANVDLTGCP